MRALGNLSLDPGLEPGLVLDFGSFCMTLALLGSLCACSRLSRWGVLSLVKKQDWGRDFDTLGPDPPPSLGRL